MQAHDDLKINPAAGVYPGVKEAKAYFMGLRLSNGALISPRSAEKLASFCRPVVGMRGGSGSKESRRMKGDTLSP
jgi:hypothetical protein